MYLLSLQFWKIYPTFSTIFSIHYAEEFDFYANIISKYLFYQFNDYIEAGGGQKQTIRHTAKVKHSIGLKKFEERETGNFWSKK